VEEVVERIGLMGSLITCSDHFQEGGGSSNEVLNLFVRFLQLGEVKEKEPIALTSLLLLLLLLLPLHLLPLLFP